MAAESLPEPLSITLRNLKQHREFTVDLTGRLVVLVGPNGVGKSTILKALLGIGRLGDDIGGNVSFEQRISHALNPLRTEPKTDAVTDVVASWSQQTGSSVRVDYEGAQLTLKLGHDRATRELLISTETFGGLDRDQLMAERCRSPLVRALRSAYLQPEFSRLSEPSPVANTRLGNRGENLATVVAQLLLRFPDVHGAVLAGLKQIIPTVTHVGVDSVTMHETNEPAYELEFQFGRNRIRAADVSEGTLIALAVLVLINRAEGLRLVLLDDIDRGLHPLAQKALVEQLRGVLAARPELKIICTSHSPYLVEHFQASEVRVLGRKKNGDTVCKRLDQHPEWQKYKEHLDTGSYWASVGEDWVGQD